MDFLSESQLRSKRRQIMKTVIKTWLLVIFGLTMIASNAYADDYPTRTVRVLVGYAPGGAPDIVARFIGQRLTQVLKQSFIVENKPGAGGTLATNQIAKASADGYTIMVLDIGQLAIAPYIFKGLPYDPIKDFTPIGRAAVVPMVLAANADSHIKTMADLIQLAKASPGKITYGSSGIGSIHHIAMEMLKSEAGIDLKHVPYKGSGESVPALLGGQVQVAMTAYPAVGSFAKSGKVNILAVTSEKRFPRTPDVPALSETYKNYDYASEIGVVGPAGLPSDVVTKLSSALKSILAESDIQNKLLGVGAISSWLSPQDYSENIRLNLAKYKKAVEISHAVQN
jgi:tripartite-type tricarboxylate transporter receptor subunit TctC